MLAFPSALSPYFSLAWSIGIDLRKSTFVPFLLLAFAVASTLSSRFLTKLLWLIGDHTLTEKTFCYKCTKFIFRIYRQAILRHTFYGIAGTSLFTSALYGLAVKMRGKILVAIKNSKKIFNNNLTNSGSVSFRNFSYLWMFLYFIIFLLEWVKQRFFLKIQRIASISTALDNYSIFVNGFHSDNLSSSISNLEARNSTRESSTSTLMAS